MHVVEYHIQYIQPAAQLLVSSALQVTFNSLLVVNEGKHFIELILTN